MSERSPKEILERSYIDFDRIRPLEPGKDGEQFHVELKVDSVQKLFLDLKLLAGENVKILFSGHQGCGKSTQLNYLAVDPDIKERFLVIKYSVQDLLNPVEDPASPFLELLHNLALLEYRNGEDKWRRPHPVLKTLLERDSHA